MRYTIGLDLGMGAEPTALAVLERRQVLTTDRPEERQPPYALRHLHRFPQGTSYPIIAQELLTLLRTPPLPGSRLMIDYTGVGKSICRLVLAGLHGKVSHSWTAVRLIAGNDASNPAAGELHIPKTDLIGILQVVLQTRRLFIARELPHAPLLLRELENYRPKVVLPTTETISWRDGQHDDLILAVALAAWASERTLAEEGRREVKVIYR